MKVLRDLSSFIHHHSLGAGYRCSQTKVWHEGVHIQQNQCLRGYHASDQSVEQSHDVGGDVCCKYVLTNVAIG